MSRKNDVITKITSDSKPPSNFDLENCRLNFLKIKRKRNTVTVIFLTYTLQLNKKVSKESWFINILNKQVGV